MVSNEKIRDYVFIYCCYLSKCIGIICSVHIFFGPLREGVFADALRSVAWLFGSVIVSVFHFTNEEVRAKLKLSYFL